MMKIKEAITKERSTLHIMDNERRIALVERKGKDTIYRFQLSDHLGSSALEVDEQGNRITYEEYYAYGGTAFLVGIRKAEVDRKRYRYSGKERDDETGLYYYGARYYAPWMGRWCNVDPLKDPVDNNLFLFNKNNPERFFDPDGKRPIGIIEKIHNSKMYKLLFDIDYWQSVKGPSRADKIIERLEKSGVPDYQVYPTQSFIQADENMAKELAASGKFVTSVAPIIGDFAVIGLTAGASSLTQAGIIKGIVNKIPFAKFGFSNKMQTVLTEVLTSTLDEFVKTFSKEFVKTYGDNEIFAESGKKAFGKLVGASISNLMFKDLEIDLNRLNSDFVQKTES
jgi:RHS repeat-associated protein